MRKAMIGLVVLLLVLTALPANAASPAQAGGQAYTVKAGDYLGKLAQENYGDVRKWPAIWKATNTQAQTDSSYAAIDDPNLIEVGWKLWLPDAAEVDTWQAADWSASARIIDRGVVGCFASGLQDDEGNPINCETSAVAYDGTNVIMASDKPIPCDACSPVFAVTYADNTLDTASRTYYTAQPFVDAIKYEDMTVTPDNQYVIATTGFDRVRSDSSWNGYNTMLVWPKGNPDAVKVVAPSTVDGVTSSVGLRARFAQALKNDQFPDGMPYFKVEGLAATPGNKLLFGIREQGASYEDFTYVTKFVQASYTIASDGTLTLGDDFAVVYEHSPVLRQTVALSSIEYDRYGDRLYLLTSYETASTDEGLGGYLWTLSMSDLGAGNAPRLVFKDVLTPLTFAHKAEGVTVISANRVLVIHDDDRVLGRDDVTNPETQFHREANQGAYTLVEFR
ncbi:MAG: LysM peptidoglycan-binding domain-containing protein [Chloroflexi bacterium]|nr:LysM peptidoglycan-binding domain-containing protein [Chloroflexota bacterium]MBU1750756.1 LysM peptidoglycan-binding domain-containing protein [Chloroflexota bacterium]